MHSTPGAMDMAMRAQQQRIQGKLDGRMKVQIQARCRGGRRELMRYERSGLANGPIIA